METYVKLCPDCRTATALQVVRCHKCGHVYRTRFDPATGQAVSHAGAPAGTVRWVVRMRGIHEGARAIVSLMLLLLTYAGPLAIVFVMNLLKDRPESPVLIPFLVCVNVIWLWYLSDSR